MCEISRGTREVSPARGVVPGPADPRPAPLTDQAVVSMDARRGARSASNCRCNSGEASTRGSSKKRFRRAIARQSDSSSAAGHIVREKWSRTSGETATCSRLADARGPHARRHAAEDGCRLGGPPPVPRARGPRHVQHADRLPGEDHGGGPRHAGEQRSRRRVPRRRRPRADHPRMGRVADGARRQDRVFPRRRRQKNKEAKQFPVERGEDMTEHWKQFLDCCRAKDPKTNSPADLAYHVQTALIMGSWSLKQGKVAKFDAGKQQIVMGA